MLIDTHCHLNFKAFDNDVDDVVRRAQEAGVTKIIIPGTDLVSSRRAVAIAQTYDSCYAAVGIHPHHAQDPELASNNELRHELEKLLKQNRVVAMGEIGLDNHVYKKSKYEQIEITDEIKQKQKDLLALQLELALIHNKPVILHSRDAYDDLIQTISTYSRSSPTEANYIKPNQSTVKTLRGVFHCFTGSTPQLSLITTMGYYVGFDGNITYSSDYTSLVRALPLEKLLIETDAPFLTPVPHRGTRNEPAYLQLVAHAVAEYHRTPLESVANQTTYNALQLFDLS